MQKRAKFRGGGGGGRGRSIFTPVRVSKPLRGGGENPQESSRILEKPQESPSIIPLE